MFLSEAWSNFRIKLNYLQQYFNYIRFLSISYVRICTIENLHDVIKEFPRAVLVFRGLCLHAFRIQCKQSYRCMTSHKTYKYLHILRTVIVKKLIKLISNIYNKFVSYVGLFKLRFLNLLVKMNSLWRQKYNLFVVAVKNLDATSVLPVTLKWKQRFYVNSSILN